MSRFCLLTFAIVLILNLNSRAQDKVEENLSTAQSAYQDKNYEDARFALQQSLAELDIVISKEILKKLPTELEGYASNAEDDQVMGNSMGITGLNVNRTYGEKGNALQYVDLTIISNSPMLAGITSFLTNPLFMNMADESQKSIKIQSYKGVLQKGESSDETPTYDLQIPIAQSLMSMNFNGFDDENEVLRLVNLIDLGGIAGKLLWARDRRFEAWRGAHGDLPNRGDACLPRWTSGR